MWEDGVLQHDFDVFRTVKIQNNTNSSSKVRAELMPLNSMVLQPAKYELNFEKNDDKAILGKKMFE